MLKKVFVFLFLGVLLVGCGKVVQPFSWQKSKIFKVEFAVENVEGGQVVEGGSEPLAKTFYFEYPAEAQVSGTAENGQLVYQNCVLHFGDEEVKELMVEYDSSSYSEKKIVEKVAHVYRQNDDRIILYVIETTKFMPHYYFWLDREGGAGTICHDFAHKIADSFDDKPFYSNQKFGFRAAILPNFSVEYLNEGEGIVMRRGAEGEYQRMDKVYQENYTVEIGVKAFANTLNYPDLSAMVFKEFPDLSNQFVGNAVYVDQGDATEAIRHYFMMSGDGSYIYEAYLKLPSVFYPRHAQGFEDFLKTIEIF